MAHGIFAFKKKISEPASTGKKNEGGGNIYERMKECTVLWYIYFAKPVSKSISGTADMVYIRFLVHREPRTGKYVSSLRM